MVRVTAILLAFTLAVPAVAQEAIYRGRRYTPTSYPRATYCQCSMCRNIRAQWARATPKAPDATPQKVVLAMLGKMNLSAEDVLWDVGCGDGRFLIAAAKRYGCRGIGIEIDPRTAQRAREKIRAAGLTGLVAIVTTDALKYDYGEAKKVVIYQHDDLQALILEKLPGGTLVATYAHRPEGMDAREFRAGAGVFYVGRTRRPRWYV